MSTTGGRRQQGLIQATCSNVGLHEELHQFCVPLQDPFKAALHDQRAKLYMLM
jgi:hypothetical protein